MNINDASTSLKREETEAFKGFDEAFVHLRNLEHKLKIMKQTLHIPSLQKDTEYTISSTVHQKQIHTILGLVESGYYNLKEATQILRDKRRELLNVDQDAFSKFTGASSIYSSKLFSANNNSVQQPLNNERDFEKTVIWLKYKIEHFLEHQDITISDIYQELSRLALHKKQIVIDNNDLSIQDLKQLNHTLSPLEKVYSLFDEFFWKLVTKVLQNCDRRDSVLVKEIVFIIEKETETYKAYLEKSTGNYVTNKIKISYKQKFDTLVANCIETKITEISKKENIDYYEIIACLTEEACLLDKICGFCDIFPKDYKLNWLVINQYNTSIHKKLLEVLSKEKKNEALTEEKIFFAIKFANTYIENINKIKKRYLIIISLDSFSSLESDLVKEYKCMVSNKFRNWIDELTEKLRSSLAQRSTCSTIDLDGKVSFSISINMFQMFHQQLESINDSHSGHLSYNVIRECAKAISYYQELIRKIVEQEMNSYLDSPMPFQGFPQFLISIANDQQAAILLCANLTENSQKILENSQYSTVAKTLLKEQDVLISYNNHYIIRQLSNVTYKKVYKPLFKKLFTKAWYSEEVMAEIVVIINDYCSDYKKIMHKDVFFEFVNRLMTDFVDVLIRRLKGDASVFILDQFEEKALKELIKVQELFIQHIDSSDVKKNFEAYERLISYITTNKGDLHTSFEALKIEYPDISKKFVKRLLSKRSDMSFLKLQGAMHRIKKVDSKCNLKTQSLKSRKSSVFTNIQTQNPENSRNKLIN